MSVSEDDQVRAPTDASAPECRSEEERLERARPRANTWQGFAADIYALSESRAGANLFDNQGLTLPRARTPSRGSKMLYEASKRKVL